jgi:hypothetical protein
VPIEHPAHMPAQVGAHALLHRPVDAHAPSHRLHQVAGDGAQGGVAEDLDGVVVDAGGVGESQLIFTGALKPRRGDVSALPLICAASNVVALPL